MRRTQPRRRSCRIAESGIAQTISGEAKEAVVKGNNLANEAVDFVEKKIAQTISKEAVAEKRSNLVGANKDVAPGPESERVCSLACGSAPPPFGPFGSNRPRE